MNILSKVKALARRQLDIESRALFRNSSWFFLTNANAAVCDLLRSVVLARGLGAEGFGIYILVTILVRTIQEFFNLNVGSALIKFGAEYTSSGQTTRLAALLKGCFIIAAVTAVASVVFVVIADEFAYDTFISQPGLSAYVQLYAIAAGFSFFDNVSISLLNLHFRFRLNSVIKMSLDLAELAIIAMAVLLVPGDLAVLFAAAISVLLLKGIVYNGAALWEMRELVTPNLRVSLAEIGADRRRIAGFLVNNSLSRTVHTLIFSGDVLLLGALTGPMEVGYYSIAKKLAFAILRLTDPMATSSFPQLATLVAQRNLAGIKLMLTRMSTIIACMAAGMLAVALVAGGRLTTLVYGEEYRPASTAFSILVAAAGVGAVLFWSTSLIMSLGRVDARLKAYLAALVVGASTAWFLIPQYGATGLAIAMLAAIVVMQGILVFVCRLELRG